MECRKSLYVLALYLFIIALNSHLVNMGHAAVPNQLPLGVRPLGMAESFVAVADDVNAIAWNPAGLVQLRHQAINTMYTNLYGTGLIHSYLSGVWPFTNRHAVGIDWSHLGFDDDELNIDDDRFTLSYGFRLIRQLSLGANFRYVRVNTSLDGEPLGSASGFGVDAALRFEPIPKLSFGLFGQDLTNTKVRKDAEIAPRRLRVGIAYRPINKTLVALDIDDRIHLGAEKWFADTLALRGGIARDIGNFHLPDSDSKFREPMSFALGGSIKYGTFQFDYAYLNTPTLSDTHRFGLTFAPGDSTHKVSIEPVRLSDVLASFYTLYATPNSLFGEIALSSSHTRKIPVTVSIFIPEYMDKPTEVARGVIPASEPGKVSDTTKIPLSLPLNQKIRSLRDDWKTEAVITVAYRRKLEQIEYTTPITLRAMGQVAYSNCLDPMVAFIDPGDPVVRDFADAAINVPLEATEPALVNMRRASENILKAMQIFEALNEHGIRYAEDTYTPFQSIYGRNTVAPDAPKAGQETPFQYIELNGPFKRTHYPRELLSKADQTGDCDDLSILYASLLEASGIQTQLVDVKSRVFVMFDSGLKEDNIRELNLDEGNFIRDSGVFWVPVEITMFGNLFAEAWRKGIATYSDAEGHGVLRRVDVHDSWETYPPMHLVMPLSQIPPPATEKIRQRILSNLTGFHGFVIK